MILQETEGIGKVIAGSLFDYLHDMKHLMIIDKLRNAGVLMEEIEEEHAGGAFEGENGRIDRQAYPHGPP